MSFIKDNQLSDANRALMLWEHPPVAKAIQRCGVFDGELYGATFNALLDAARSEGRAEQVAQDAKCSITDAQGVAWFEARFGVPIGDKPGAADVAALSNLQQEA